MAGHLFVIQGDITQLACDAWLLPGGPAPRPGSTWRDAVGALAAEPLSSRWGEEGSRVVRWTPKRPDEPSQWLTYLGGSIETPIEWYLDGGKEFLSRASEDLEGHAPQFERHRHLLSMPLVGTGQGGKHHRAGAIARELLPLLYHWL